MEYKETYLEDRDSDIYMKASVFSDKIKITPTAVYQSKIYEDVKTYTSKGRLIINYSKYLRIMEYSDGLIKQISNIYHKLSKDKEIMQFATFCINNTEDIELGKRPEYISTLLRTKPGKAGFLMEQKRRDKLQSVLTLYNYYRSEHV